MRHANNHLIYLLASYEQNDYLYLILPWAELDLSQYWQSDLSPPLKDNVEISIWLKEQCCGLAGAVSQLHRYRTMSATTMVYHKIKLAEQSIGVAARSHAKTTTEQKRTIKLFGRHGDIKPTNILWFPNRKVARGYGTLKLSDFGTTRFSDDKNKAVLDGECVPDSRPYQSPESQIPDRRLSVQCDVWSLGCVFLEFLCWYFGGRERVEAFERERSFGYESSAFFFLKVEDNLHLTSAELKPSVTKVSLTHRPPESIT